MRLREFGEKNFTSMTDFATALSMLPQTLNSYLSGASGIGSKMQEKLRELGCDIEWLMTGEKGEQKHHAYTLEEEAILKRLRELGIDTKEKFDQYLSPESLASDLALVLRERMVKHKVRRKK